ncbi:hypothetical protein [Dysosmobacter sp.]|uniref:hypothetical protein n=1 Tax=Dysosmobacter sp. TaxID=2591382 RepID=UPI002A8A5A80|nr:hypothetical protein [Dysosmobacter sp.]MDY3985479.1 hypothetical protein [Dysosmobacter sp.]
MMVTRKVRCRKCGTVTLLTYPDKLSEIGLNTISLCKACREMELRKNKEENTK